MFIGALTLIMVKILPAQSVCVFDANPWQFQGSGKNRRQNRDGMVADGSDGGAQSFELWRAVSVALYESRCNRTLHR